jgi:hypothetical protein
MKRVRVMGSVHVFIVHFYTDQYKAHTYKHIRLQTYVHIFNVSSAQ